MKAVIMAVCLALGGLGVPSVSSASLPMTTVLLPAPSFAQPKIANVRDRDVLEAANFAARTSRKGKLISVLAAKRQGVGKVTYQLKLRLEKGVFNVIVSKDTQRRMKVVSFKATR